MYIYIYTCDHFESANLTFRNCQLKKAITFFKLIFCNRSSKFHSKLLKYLFIIIICIVNLSYPSICLPLFLFVTMFRDLSKKCISFLSICLVLLFRINFSIYFYSLYF